MFARTTEEWNGAVRNRFIQLYRNDLWWVRRDQNERLTRAEIHCGFEAIKFEVERMHTEASHRKKPQLDQAQAREAEARAAAEER